MIGYVDGTIRMHCDWCYKRSEPGPNPDIPLRPVRWGIGRRGDEYRHACPSHTRQLRAWERGDA